MIRRRKTCRKDGRQSGKKGKRRVSPMATMITASIVWRLTSTKAYRGLGRLRHAGKPSDVTDASSSNPTRLRHAQ